MRNYRVFTTLCFIFCVSTFLAALGEAEWSRWTLWPGESYTFERVKVTWKVTPSKEAPSEKTHSLTFQGPTATISSVLRSPEIGDLYVYLDEVVFEIGGNYKERALSSLEFKAQPQSSKNTFTGAPTDLRLYLSSVCPVSLDQWRLSISEEPVPYPDGSEYLELIMLNTETNTKSTMPAVQGANRRFGRFDIMVGYVSEQTRTAMLRIDVFEDETVRGRDAYAERLTLPGDSSSAKTYAQLLEILGKKYGFTVEWVEFSGHPESIEYIKNLELYGNWNFKDKTIPYILEELFVRSKPETKQLALEWKTPTHLVVRAKNYDKVIAEREEQAGIEERRKYLEQLFQKEYTALTKLYLLKKISPATAHSLIRDELANYYLLKEKTSGKERLYASLGKKGPYFIASDKELKGKEISPECIIAMTEEKATADEKSNRLIVIASPKTHERIQALLAKAQGLLEAKEEEKEVKPYRIEVVLLQGGKSGEKVKTTGTKPRFGEITLRHKVGGEVLPQETKALLPLLDQTEETADSALVKFDPELIPRYGISEEDLKLFGFDAVAELGKGAVSLLPERGEAGRALLALTDAYRCELQFLDVREPYLIVKGSLREADSNKPLLENTLYLEKDKPSVLGLTNLRQALILVLRLHDSP